MKPHPITQPPVVALCNFLLLLLLAITPVASAQEAKSGFELTREADSAAKAGKWEEAEKLMTIAVARMREESGPEHPSVGMNLRYLAEIQARRGRVEECIRSLSESTALLEKSLGKENPMAFSARYLWLVELRRAKRFAEAAAVGGELFGTLSTFIKSGRAKDASLDRTNLGNGILQVKPDEGGLADVASLWGLSLATSGKDTEARPVLLDALARIEKLFGVGHPRAVDVQQALEKIDIARGKAVGRRYVGDLTSIRNIVMSGNTTFTTDDLRSALAKDGATILASHPSAPFPDLLLTIKSALTRGYQKNGFPEVSVKAALQTSPAPLPRIVVAIQEGPGFRKGKVTVTGVEAAIATSLTTALTTTTKTASDSLIHRIEGLMAGIQAPHPEELNKFLKQLNGDLPRFQVSAGSEKLAGQTEEEPFPALFSGSDSRKPLWEEDSPVDYTPTSLKNSLQEIQAAFRSLGYPLARWTHELRRQPGGTCDLVISVGNLGPRAVIGNITVVGKRKNTAEQIIALTGLKSGAPLDPRALSSARLALWDCGRFWPFTVQALPRGDDTPEFEVIIGIQEIEKAPALDAPLTDVQQAGLTFARQLNRSVESQGFTVRLKQPSFDLELAHSPELGLAARLQSPSFPGLTSMLSLGREELNLVFRGESKTSVCTVPIQDQTLETMVTITPEYPIKEKNPMGLSARWSYRSSPPPGGSPVPFTLLFSPCYVFVTNETLTMENGKLMARRGDAVQLIADPTTGNLLEMFGAPLSFDQEHVRAIHSEIGSFNLDPATQRSALSWAGMLAAGIGHALGVLHDAPNASASGKRSAPDPLDFRQALASQISEWFPSFSKFAPARIKAAERITHRLLLPVLERFFQSANAGKSPNGSDFSIPPDEKQLEGTTASMLVGFGYVSLCEEFFPPDSWATTLSRELLFSLSGNSRYTARTMDTLLEDPMLGPLGALVTSQLVRNFSPAHASRFEQKALDQCHAAGFRQDWKLALREGTGFHENISGILDTLAKLSPADEADLVLLLGPEREPWLKEFLSALRTRPQGQSLADCLAPHLDKLWDQHLGPVLKDNLNRRLHPPVDTTKVAAVVNGQAIPRRFVDFFRWVPLALPGCVEKEAKGDEWALARRQLVRLVLANQAFAKKGGNIDPAKMEDGFSSLLPPSLKNADDDAFTRTCGLTRKEALAFFQWSMVTNEMLRIVAREVPPPTEEDIARWKAGPGGTIGEEYHLHKIRLPAPDLSTFSGRYIASQRASILRHVLERGLPEDLLKQAIDLDGDSVAEFVCSKSVANHALMPNIVEAMDGVAEGAWTTPVAENAKVSIISPIARRPGKLPEGEYGAQVAQGRVRRHKEYLAVAGWFEQMEQQATIEWLDGPRPDAESDKEQFLKSAVEWAKSTPASLLARLAHLWLLLPTKDVASINAAMDTVLALPSLTPEHSAALAKALVKAGHPELAARAKKNEGTAP